MATLSANKIKFIRSLAQKKFRDQHNLFIAEGEKVVAEALASGYNVKEVYYENEIGRDTMERISCLASPSPVLAVIEKPDFTPDSLFCYRLSEIFWKISSTVPIPQISWYFPCAE